MTTLHKETVHKETMDKDIIRSRHQVWRNPWHFLAFGFGSGLARFAPGTFCTLAAIPPYLLLVQLSWAVYAIVVVLAFFIGIRICQITSDDLQVHDFSGIVWDEFVGLWITLFLIPFEWQWLALGFILFRFFDIFKPFPVNWCDKNLHGGIGVVVDDLMAGVMAHVVLRLFLIF